MKQRFLLGLPFDEACRLAVLQQHERALDQAKRFLGLFGLLADVRLNGAERIVRRLRRGGLRQRVEERRLAHVWHADDAAFETHDRYSPSLVVSWRSFQFTRLFSSRLCR